ncbi:MAG: hypothetical protein ACYTDU_06280 [Planctomycetota bacterium]|jgi:hypothetical protein
MRKAALSCLLLALALPAVADEQSDELEKRIAQVIYNTSKQERDLKAPAPEVIARWRSEKLTSRGERLYTYVGPTPLHDPGGSEIRWQFQVRVLPSGWEPSAEAEKRWAGRAAGTDEKTGGEIAFLAGETEGRKHARVYFRLVRGGLKLVMAITRAGEWKRDDAIRLSKPRWQFFVEEAERQGLFGRIRFVVRRLAVTPEEGRVRQGAEDAAVDREPVRDGASISFVWDHEDHVVLPLRVHVEAPEIKAGQPYTVHVRLKDDPEPLGVSLRARNPQEPLVDGDGDGWYEVTVAGKNRPEVVNVRFNRFLYAGPKPAVRSAAGIDQVAALELEYRGGKAGAVRGRFRCVVQRRDWWPIVRRFEVVGTDKWWKNPQPPRLSPTLGAGGDQAARLGPRDRYPLLVRAWSNLWNLVLTPGRANEKKHVVKPQAFELDEAVPLSWRVAASGQAFYLCVLDQAPPELPGFPAETPFVLMVDVGIIGVPEWGSDADELAVEQALRARLKVRKCTVSVARVSGEGYGLAPGPEGEDHAARLRRLKPLENEFRLKIRRAVPMAIRGWSAPRPSESVLLQVGKSGAKLDDLLPLRVEGGRVTGTRTIPLPFEKKGICEVRLKLHVVAEADSGTKSWGAGGKGFDVALRYNVAPAGTKTDPLEYDRIIRAPPEKR